MNCDPSMIREAMRTLRKINEKVGDLEGRVDSMAEGMTTFRTRLEEAEASLFKPSTDEKARKNGAV